jgi:prepilin-type N-terminal cleavage/methylation domain-containing protein
VADDGKPKDYIELDKLHLRAGSSKRDIAIMKSAFSYNLLKHLHRKQAKGGFTLIELLVVIIIIGILAAIALPSFLNQANRARETEATNAIGALNRGQQAYYLERVAFTTEFSRLDVGVDAEGENYNLAKTRDGGTPGEFTVSDIGGIASAAVYAVPATGKQLRGFGGLSYIYSGNNGNQTTAILCREVNAQAQDSVVASDMAATDCGSISNMETTN